VNWQTHSPGPQKRSPLLVFPARWPRSLQGLDTSAALLGDGIFPTASSSAIFLRFRRKGAGTSLSRPLWAFPVSLPRLQPILLSSYLCRIKQKENSSCSSSGQPLQNLTHHLLDCPTSYNSFSGAPSLALLLPFLASGPNLGARPDCRVQGRSHPNTAEEAKKCQVGPNIYHRF